LADRQGHARQVARGRAHQGDGQELGQRGRHAERDLAAGAAAQARELVAQAFHLVQQAAAALEQHPPGFGRGDAAAVADQQRLAQFHFQQPHLAAERRLGHVQHHGGTGEAAEFGYLHEIGDLAQVHGSTGAAGRRWPILRAAPQPSRSSTSLGVSEREQQGVNSAPELRSSSVRNWSRWSGMPARTRVTHVPQMPCSHDSGMNTPYASRHWATLWSAATRNTRPSLISTSNPSLPGASTVSALKDSLWKRPAPNPAASQARRAASMKPAGPQA